MAKTEVTHSSRLRYSPQGQKLKEFHERNDFVRVLIGPLGSGKTQACITEILYRMDHQAIDINGLRRSRWVVVRNTLPDLITTTVKDFREIVDGTGMGLFKMGTPPTWSGSYVRPQDGSTVEFEVIFLAFDHP